MIFEHMKEGDNPKTLEINKLDLWVQLHGMNAGFMSQRVVTDVGNYIGKFVESDENNFVGVWREYLRVRVTIDLKKPLKRRMKLRKNQTNWCWVNFRYEGIPTFCFICGMIGHGEKFCDKIFESPVDEIERPYGAWMKAEPRRRNHTMGAKWLRQGGKNPVNFHAEQPVEEGRKMVTMKDAANDSNPVNLGNKMEITGYSQQTGVADKYGTKDIIGDNLSLINADSNVDEIAGEKLNLNEEIGLQILDPKRRRIEEPKSSGPSTDIVTEVVDTDMTEDERLTNLGPKNVKLVGSAQLTRQSL